MRHLCIIGSTGSIGRQALELVAEFRNEFKVSALVAGSNIDSLAKQVKIFSPPLVALADSTKLDDFIARLDALNIDRNRLEIYSGQKGVVNLVKESNADVFLTAAVGIAGLESTLAALKSGKHVAIANKEPFVAAGALCRKVAEQYGTRIVPVDSEHSAIFQALSGHQKSDVSKIILSCSGGPFLDAKRFFDLSAVTKKEALNHPRWQMGEKISIDSATLMNKALEMIEARWLFNLSVDQIDVVIHPQSIIHSMVEFKDGAILAQLGVTDMKIPIAYGLSYPERLALIEQTSLVSLALNFSELSLDFRPVDHRRFRAIRLAKSVLSETSDKAVIFNAANEIAVEAFLAERIRFDAIIEVIEACLAKEAPDKGDDLDSIRRIDQWAREYTQKRISLGLLKR